MEGVSVEWGDREKAERERGGASVEGGERIRGERGRGERRRGERGRGERVRLLTDVCVDKKRQLAKQKSAKKQGG